MFFGLYNSSATFQKMIDNLFAIPLAEWWILIYMDNILIFSNNKENLRHYTHCVLEILANHDLYLKLEKCKFEKTEIEYLGFIIGNNQIQMDPKKVQGILDWPVPINVQQVHSFLGFGNFYQCFIYHYSELAYVLNQLTKKNYLFNWTNDQQLAFEELKEQFISQPVLTMPDTTKPFLLETDASKFATGAVLIQKNDFGWLHPISFLSQSFSETGWQYCKGTS